MHTFDSKLKHSSATVSRRPKSEQYTVGNIKHNQQPQIRNILHSPVVQPKLTVGQPNDKYEQEADQVADQVMAMRDPKLQRQPEEEEKEKMAQAKGDGGPSIASSSVESGINSIRGGGSTLPESTHANEHLDAEEGILVGLTAAISLNCQPCIRYYQSQVKKAGISEGKVSEVVAKIMAVSANKKRLQTEEVLNRHEV